MASRVQIEFRSLIIQWKAHRKPPGLHIHVPCRLMYLFNRHPLGSMPCGAAYTFMSGQATEPTAPASASRPGLGAELSSRPGNLLFSILFAVWCTYTDLIRQQVGIWWYCRWVPWGRHFVLGYTRCHRALCAGGPSGSPPARASWGSPETPQNKHQHTTAFSCWSNWVLGKKPPSCK